MRVLRRIGLTMAAVLLVAVTVLATSGLGQKPGTRLPAGTVDAPVVVYGTPIRYVRQGCGPGLLLLHGTA